MRMGRVLAVVAGALVFFIAALGLAVYFTRDEDNLQADNLLAESFTKAVYSPTNTRRGTNMSRSCPVGFISGLRLPPTDSRLVEHC